MASKFCKKCQLTKSVNDFNKSISTQDEYRYNCKTCNAENVKQWRSINKNHAHEQRRIYYHTNLQGRTTENVHNRLNIILKRSNYSVRTEQIIELNKPTYLEWLSYNFENEMT